MAETLFNKGIELMEQEKLDRACPYLEESYRRDPLLGALIALADCEYDRGRLATALKKYQEYVDRHAHLAEAARTKQGSRLTEARARITELKSAAPSIKVTVPEEAQVPILHLDGIRIRPNESYPVDPGTYEVALDEFGRETFKIKVEVRKGQKKIVPTDRGKPLPARKPKLRRDLAEGEPFDYDADHRAWKAWMVVGSVELGLVIIACILGPRALDSYGLTVFGNPAAPPLRTAQPMPATAPTMSSSAAPMWVVPATVGAGSIALATAGIIWAARSQPASVGPNVSILPLVQVGTTPDTPTMFGFQGRF